MPAQWASTPRAALAAANDMLFDPSRAVLSHDIDEAYSMPVGGDARVRLEGSAWGLCMAAVGQLWSTMPVVNGTRAAGWEALLGVDWRDPAALAAAVRKLLAPALAKSPLFWHKGRRHAPTPSAFCTQPTPAAPPVGSRLQVGRVDIQLLQAALSSTTTTLAPAPQGGSFILRGFSWGLVGSLTCLCAEATSSGDCRLSMTDVCAQPPPCLQQTCASGGLTRNLPILFGLRV